MARWYLRYPVPCSFVPSIASICWTPMMCHMEWIMSHPLLITLEADLIKNEQNVKPCLKKLRVKWRGSEKETNCIEAGVMALVYSHGLCKVTGGCGAGWGAARAEWSAGTTELDLETYVRVSSSFSTSQKGSLMSISSFSPSVTMDWVPKMILENQRDKSLDQPIKPTTCWSPGRWQATVKPWGLNQRSGRLCLLLRESTAEVRWPNVPSHLQNS